MLNQFIEGKDQELHKAIVHINMIQEYNKMQPLLMMNIWHAYKNPNPDWRLWTYLED